MLSVEVNKCIEQVDEFKELVVKQIDADSFMRMEPENLIAIKKALGIVQTCENIMKETSDKLEKLDELDKINEKLDRLLVEVKK